jgi:hypothetical protein
MLAQTEAVSCELVANDDAGVQLACDPVVLALPPPGEGLRGVGLASVGVDRVRRGGGVRGS